MPSIMGGGVNPPPAKKFVFFQTKCKKYSACPENLFFIKTIFMYCRPCLVHTGSKAAGPESIKDYFQIGALLSQKRH